MMRQSPVLIFPVASAYFPVVSGAHGQCSAVCFQCSVSVVSGQCQLSATVVVISPQQPVDSEFGGQSSLGPSSTAWLQPHGPAGLSDSLWPVPASPRTPNGAPEGRSLITAN